MAYTSTNASAPSSLAIFMSKVGEALVSIGQAAFVSRGMEARMQKIEELRRMSNEELAKMGLHRDDIPAYVFRDILYT